MRQVRRVNLEYLVYLDTLVDKAPRVRSVSRDSQVPTGRRELGDCKANWDKGDNVGPQDREVNVDQGERLANRDQRERQGLMDLLALLVKGDFLDHKDLLDSPDQRDLTDLQGRTDCQDIPGSEGKWVSKARRAQLDHQVL